MDRPDESRRQHVTASDPSRPAAPRRDPHTPEPASTDSVLNGLNFFADAPEPAATDPVLIELTRDEQLNGLDFFAAEEPQISERVPAPVDSIEIPDPTPGLIARDPAPKVDKAQPKPPPVHPEAWDSLTWQAPLLAAALAAVVVVYGFMSVRVMRTTPGGQLATLTDRTAERTKPAPDVPATAAVAATPTPSTGTRPATDEPTSLTFAELIDDLAASNKVSEPFVSRESATLPAPARPAPPSSPGRQAARVRRDPPIRSAAVPRPRTAEPVPVPEPAVAPLVSSPTLPASLPVQPSPVAVPAPPPRAEASAAPLPRIPAPETAIQTVLTQYRIAYRELDAGAARAVWPSVDAKALRKAFDRLEQQDLIFNSCQIAIDDVRAVASCHGSAWYVPRVGNRDPHDDQRQWEFKLSKVDEVWLIDTVSAR